MKKKTNKLKDGTGLDIFFLLIGGLIVFSSKDTTNQWGDILLTAFGGMIIGSSIAYMTIKA